MLDVIELLAAATEDRLRFSDVVRELGLTQATAHAILTTLSDRGWINRDPIDKTFSLGPAVIMKPAIRMRSPVCTDARVEILSALAGGGKIAVLEALGGIAKDYEVERYVPKLIIVEGDRAAAVFLDCDGFAL